VLRLSCETPLRHLLWLFHVLPVLKTIFAFFLCQVRPPPLPQDALVAVLATAHLGSVYAMFDYDRQVAIPNDAVLFFLSGDPGLEFSYRRIVVCNVMYLPLFLLLAVPPEIPRTTFMGRTPSFTASLNFFGCDPSPFALFFFERNLSLADSGEPCPT